MIARIEALILPEVWNLREDLDDEPVFRLVNVNLVQHVEADYLAAKVTDMDF